MDNSPLWDEPLARLAPAAEDIPHYRRTDLEVAPAGERPSAEDYDRYTYLVRRLRDAEYHSERIRDTAAFAVQDVLFNSLLARSNRDLAKIAAVLGLSPGGYEEWAGATAAAMEERLWAEQESAYLDFDVVAGRHIPAVTAAAFTPLFGGVPSPERATRMRARLDGFRVKAGAGSVVAGLAPDDPAFQPSLYWRGPIWININWLLRHGLQGYGFEDEGRLIRAGIIELARRGGFREHYNPLTLEGQGAEQFAWTAALVLDLVLELPQDGEGGASQ
jgi:glycogen debranching enzyme